MGCCGRRTVCGAYDYSILYGYICLLPLFIYPKRHNNTDITSMSGSELVSVSASWWLSYWSQNRDTGQPWFYLGVYIAINVVVILVSLAKEINVRVCGWRAANVLFKDMLQVCVRTVLYGYCVRAKSSL